MNFFHGELSRGSRGQDSVGAYGIAPGYEQDSQEGLALGSYFIMIYFLGSFYR
jgi:hypothetical protein